MQEINNNIISFPKKSKVLVTGASGFTGSLLLRKLCNAGMNVSAISRKKTNTKHLNDLPVKWHISDVSDEKIIQEAVKDQEYIFHLAASLREAKSNYNDHWRVHVKSTELLCNYALRSNTLKRYVHVSTIGVHGHIDDPPANEEYRFSPGDNYQITKLEAEKWLTDFARRNDFPYTIIRPAAIYGPGDKRLLKLFKMSLKPVFIILGNGKCMYHLTHVDDLTNAILLSATHEQALNNVFIIGDTNPIPLKEIVKTIATHYNKKTRFVRLPIGPFFLLGDICEAICRPLKIEPPIYRRRVAFYSKDRHFDTSKMTHVLGYKTRRNNQEGIIETADWYSQNNWL